MKRPLLHIISTCFTPFVLKGVASCFLLLFLLNNITKAQYWQQVGIGIDTLHAYKGVGSITVDKTGNLYVAGEAKDTIGKYFVSKWDGTHWSELGTGNNALGANSFIDVCPIIIDDTGNVYVAGDFTNSTSYSPNGKRYVAKWNGSNWHVLGTGSNALNANSGINALAKDANGNIFAAGSFDTSHLLNYNINARKRIAKWNGLNWHDIIFPDSSCSISAIITDNIGNLYVGGGFQNNNGRAYVAEWDGVKWSELGASSNVFRRDNTVFGSSINSIIFSNGSFYAVGHFVNASNNVFVAKWDGIQWGQLGNGNSIFNTFTDIISICDDSFGNLYVVPIIYNTTHNFVAKWDGSSWSKLGGNFSDCPISRIISVCSDKYSNVYASGVNVFGDTIHKAYVAKWTACRVYDTVQQTICSNTRYYFNQHWLNKSGWYNDTMNSYHSCDSIITLHLSVLPNPTKIATIAVCSQQGHTLHNGKIIFAAGNYTDTIPSATNGCDTIVSITATTLYKTKTIYAAICSNSNYQLPNGTLTNQAGIYTDTVSYTNSCDTIITTHLSLLPISTKVIYDTGCINTAYVFYGTHLINAGVYNHVLKNYLGCDSIISLHLAFSAFNLTIAMTGNHLQATAANSYQWLNCPTMQPIVGATQATFTATNNGSYALAANINGCIDTSNCIAVQVTGMEELTNKNERLTIYPNPTNEWLIVNGKWLIGNTKVEVVDVLGRKFENLKMGKFENEIQIQVSDLSSGIYFLKATDDKGFQHTAKFVKE